MAWRGEGQRRRGSRGRETYQTRGGEGAVDVEEADGVVERTFLERNVGRRSDHVEFVFLGDGGSWKLAMVLRLKLKLRVVFYECGAVKELQELFGDVGSWRLLIGKN